MTEDEIKENLRGAIGPLMLAIQDAQEKHPESTIKLMIAAEHPDRTGNIISRMDNAQFIMDVAKLVGYTEATVEDRAMFVLMKHGLK